MPDDIATAPKLAPRKFQNPDITADGLPRAVVALTHLKTLWFNTGTLCNLTCENCYIESSPENDRLVYLSEAEVRQYLGEIKNDVLGVEEIGFTGGEPFMNPEIIGMIKACLEKGFEVLILTNAMKPLHHKRDDLAKLNSIYGQRLRLRVSIDHHTKFRHEQLRGSGSWSPMIEDLKWLSENSMNIAAAGRTCWIEDDHPERSAYAALFASEGIQIDAHDPMALVLFPEMDERLDVPEITTSCWDILGVAPDSMMCATSRMVIKRKGAARPVVAPCTLIPYDPQFEMGHNLMDAATSVKLNHPHCARFCVLGGGSCSVTD